MAAVATVVMTAAKLLTAMTEETDRIIGLEMGADDYVSKPFNPRELLARIKTVLRRANSLPPRRDRARAEIVRLDHWTVDLGRRELIGEDSVAAPLSTAEFRLLCAFSIIPDDPDAEQLLRSAVGQAAASDRGIDNQVGRVQEIGADPHNPASSGHIGAAAIRGAICAAGATPLDRPVGRIGVPPPRSRDHYARCSQPAPLIIPAPCGVLEQPASGALPLPQSFTKGSHEDSHSHGVASYRSMQWRLAPICRRSMRKVCGNCSGSLRRVAGQILIHFPLRHGDVRFRYSPEIRRHPWTFSISSSAKSIGAIPR
jgi:hypothetical protein